MKRKTWSIWGILSVILVLLLGAGSALAQGTMTDLGTLGGEFSIAFGINGRGQVVGNSWTADGVTHAFLWEKGTMTDLGTLGGNSYARGINGRGQVVGASNTTGGALHAVLWEKGTMTDLGTLGGERSCLGGENSRARGINVLGQVVGQSLAYGGPIVCLSPRDTADEIQPV